MFSFNKNKLVTIAALFVLGLSSACSLRLLNSSSGGDNDNDNNNNNNNSATVSPNPEVSISITLSSNSGSVAVSIALPADAPIGTLIYYTTDGSDPLISSTALVYMLPFVVTGSAENVTVNAISMSPGLPASSVVTKQPWFGEWEFVGTDYLQDIDGGSFNQQISSIYTDATGTYIVTDKTYKWDGSSWTVAVAAGGCDGNDQLQVKNFFVESGAIYCSFYSAGPGYVFKTVSGVTTQLGDTLGDGHISIVPCYNTICAGLKDAFDGNKAKVKIYDAGTDSWLPMGTGVISSGQVSRAVSLVSYKDIVYAMFLDRTTIPSTVTVKRYINNNWEDITDATALSQETERKFDIDVYDDGSDEGIVYITFHRSATHSPTVRVYQDGVWSDVGTSSGEVDPVTTYIFDHVNIDVIDGVPYVTYTDYTPTPTSGHARTRFFNGASWEDLGTITYNSDSFYTKTAVFNGQLYRYVKGWWIESFGPNGSGIVSGGVADPLGTLF